MIDGSWSLPDFEQDVWEGRAEPETHDVAGFGIAQVIERRERRAKRIDACEGNRGCGKNKCGEKTLKTWPCSGS